VIERRLAVGRVLADPAGQARGAAMTAAKVVKVAMAREVKAAMERVVRAKAVKVAMERVAKVGTMTKCRERSGNKSPRHSCHVHLRGATLGTEPCRTLERR
jgi:hypothetical protein